MNLLHVQDFSYWVIRLGRHPSVAKSMLIPHQENSLPSRLPHPTQQRFILPEPKVQILPTKHQVSSIHLIQTLLLAEVVAAVLFF